MILSYLSPIFKQWVEFEAKKRKRKKKEPFQTKHSIYIYIYIYAYTYQILLNLGILYQLAHPFIYILKIKPICLCYYELGLLNT